MADDLGNIRYQSDGRMFICVVPGNPGVWKEVDITPRDSILFDGGPMPMTSAMWPIWNPVPGMSNAIFPNPEGVEYREVKSAEVGKATAPEEAKREAEKLLTGLNPRKVVPKGGSEK